MKHRSIVMELCLFVLLTGCNRTETENHQVPLLQATIWYQYSAEVKAIYYQTFNLAKQKLAQRLTQPGDLPGAVVLDIDETILDNSPQTAQQILDNQGFNNKMWDEWCSLAMADALPGALDFTKYASALGVEIFYISNRSNHLLDVTLKNMKELGFPDSDTTHLLLKQDTSNKESRREKVKKTHEVLLMIGDNLADFSDKYNERINGVDLQMVEENRDEFGTMYILLPNPMYGGWENTFRGETQEETNQLKLEALKSFREPQ